ALAAIVFYLAFSFKKLNNFAKYGDVSYGMYIYHFPIINTFVAFGLFQKTNPIIATLGIIIIVMILSFFSWHFIEKKFLIKTKKI
ncbi:MAG: acyltransferase, partial [Paludibacter sp.]